MAEKKDLLSRLKDLELKELEGNETVQKILENAKERALIFDLVGEPVRVVCAFPREVRYFYEKNRTRSDKDKLKFEDVEHDAYDIMAKLCLDAPFSIPSRWSFLGIPTGKSSIQISTKKPNCRQTSSFCTPLQKMIGICKHSASIEIS